MNGIPQAIWAWLSIHGLPGIRLLSFVSTSIVFSHAGIPRRIRLIIGIALCLALPAAIMPSSISLLSLSLGNIGILVLREFLIGQIFALVTSCLFAGFLIAGEKIALQIGLGFASFYDPATKDNTEVLSSFFQLLAMMLFLGSHALAYCLQTLYHSFQDLPLQQPDLLPWTIILGLLHFSSSMFIVGVMIALPYTAVLLVINIGLGTLNRSTPQMNIFSLGLQINIVIGLLLLFFFIRHQGEAMLLLFDQLPHWFSHLATL